MNKEIKGYCVQKGKPNPNKPVDIETNIIGKNLFETYETYEVNGRQYTDNLGHNAFISIPKEQYIEYEQLKEENKRLNSILTELEEYWRKQQEHYRYIKDNRYRTFLSKNLNKIQELKEKYK